MRFSYNNGRSRFDALHFQVKFLLLVVPLNLVDEFDLFHQENQAGICNH